MSDDDESIRIVRGGLDSIELYDVTGDELEVLEKGEPNAALKDFGLVLISICVSFAISIFTFDKAEDHIVKFALFCN